MFALVARYLPVQKDVTKSFDYAINFANPCIPRAENMYTRGQDKQRHLSYRTFAAEIRFDLVIDFVADRIRNLMGNYFHRNKSNGNVPLSAFNSAVINRVC